MRGEGVSSRPHGPALTPTSDGEEFSGHERPAEKGKSAGRRLVADSASVFRLFRGKAA